MRFTKNKQNIIDPILDFINVSEAFLYQDQNSKPTSKSTILSQNPYHVAGCKL